MSEPNVIEATEWVKKGRMNVRRSALDADDPDSWPSLWFKAFKEQMPLYKCKEVECAPPKSICESCGHRAVRPEENYDTY